MRRYTELSAATLVARGLLAALLLGLCAAGGVLMVAQARRGTLGEAVYGLPLVLLPAVIAWHLLRAVHTIVIRDEGTLVFHSLLRTVVLPPERILAVRRDPQLPLLAIDYAGGTLVCNTTARGRPAIRDFDEFLVRLRELNPEARIDAW